ncbi:transposase [Candidatus Bipolaricaulota bacterium]|nr:transposase [Candidatus Bipolaricaulota bacterium]
MSPLNVTSYFKKLLLQFVAQPNPLLAMPQWLTQQLMQLEAELKVGAQKNKHSKQRSTYFSRYRIRRFDTRLGTLYLMVPKLRNGGYVPFFVVERRRSEQPLIQVVQEAFMNRASTRKIERLAKAPGIESLSASQVSEIKKELNEHVDAFRSRTLEELYPVLWVVNAGFEVDDIDGVFWTLSSVFRLMS